MEKKILMSLQAGSGSGVDNPILANLNVHNIYLSDSAEYALYFTLITDSEEYKQPFTSVKTLYDAISSYIDNSSNWSALPCSGGYNGYTAYSIAKDQSSNQDAFTITYRGAQSVTSVSISVAHAEAGTIIDNDLYSRHS